MYVCKAWLEGGTKRLGVRCRRSAVDKSVLAPPAPSPSPHPHIHSPTHPPTLNPLHPQRRCPSLL